MTNDPRFTPLATALPATVPFVGPETQERARNAPFTARLGANENLFGPSPKAIAAMQAEAAQGWKYPDPEAHDLRTALATHHGIDPQHILLGEGIDGLLGLICRLFLNEGDTAVTSAGAYPTFNYHVTGHGGILRTIPYTADHEDPERLIATARQARAKLIYISNPDNPMGTWHDAPTVQRMIDNVPDGALLLLDEAYVELAPDGTAPAIEPSDPRVLRLRTFSKAYGLAGARVGYAIGPAPIIAGFDRIKNHFGLNRAAQAGALAALHDQSYLHAVTDQIAQGRQTLTQIASDNGLTALPSATNFVTIDCGGDGARADAVMAGLLAEGIFVRKPMVAPQDRCVRISVGQPADLDHFAKTLPRVMSFVTSL